MILLLVFLPTAGLFAGTLVHRDTVRVYFRQGKANFDPSFEDNAARIRAVGSHMSGADRVRILASASPEGSRSLNADLANRRAKSIAAFLHKNYEFQSSRLQTRYTELDWANFEELVDADESIPSRDKVKAIIARKDLMALKRMQGTASWNYMYKNLFPSLRSTFLVFEYDIELKEPEPVKVKAAVEPWVPEFLAAPVALIDIPSSRMTGSAVAVAQTIETAPSPISTVLPVEEKGEVYWRMRISDRYLKTNLLFYPLLLPSIGYEYRFANKISASFLAYYSALDWFTSDTKFRVLGIQPELRLWTKSLMFRSEWFFGLHGNFGWYNIALGGDYRYQDHQQGTPAYGGGLNIGCRVPLFLKEDTRWGIEFSLGAGYMPLWYDIYYNVPNGRLMGDKQIVYFGIDQASINLTYRIGRTEIKGRKRR